MAGSSGSSSWSILNALQNLYCYLLINMDLPSNFLYFLHLFESTMFPLPNISLKIVNWMIIKFNSPGLPIQTPPQKFDDQGLSALFLVNGFSIDLYLILSIILTLLVNLLYKILTKIGCKYIG